MARFPNLSIAVSGTAATVSLTVCSVPSRIALTLPVSFVTALLLTSGFFSQFFEILFHKGFNGFCRDAPSASSRRVFSWASATNISSVISLPNDLPCSSSVTSFVTFCVELLQWFAWWQLVSLASSTPA